MADHKPARASKRHAPATGGGAGRARRPPGGPAVILGWASFSGVW
ncbi:multimodular transpeptidase-transglycosylase [Cutibacterium acnes JCM 18918]|nr:multimodular transpeptidase-transglycosylase [Cutibacterium acnes JCM 18918]